MNISLPRSTASSVKREAKVEGFASVSEYFRHLIREEAERKLLRSLEKSRKEFESGKGKVLRSLKDLR